jgi:PleD family two-component response regulator
MIQHRSSYGKPFRLVNAQGPEVNVIQRDTVMLLIGKPGHLRNALQSLVSVAPGLDGLITADTGPMALKVMREVRPSVVLIGSGLPDMEVLELLRQTKGGWPETSCLLQPERIACCLPECRPGSCFLSSS